MSFDRTEHLLQVNTDTSVEPCSLGEECGLAGQGRVEITRNKVASASAILTLTCVGCSTCGSTTFTNGDRGKAIGQPIEAPYIGSETVPLLLDKTVVLLAQATSRFARPEQPTPGETLL
jgi:hypothetical protein